MLQLRARVDLEVMAMKRYYSKLQHYWNLTIRLFSVISGTFVGGGSHPSAEVQSVYSKAPADWAKIRLWPITIYRNKDRFSFIYEYAFYIWFAWVIYILTRIANYFMIDTTAKSLLKKHSFISLEILYVFVMGILFLLCAYVFSFSFFYL